MAKYFNYFPKTLYYKDHDAIGVETVTNIMARVGFGQSFKENTSIYYEYDVQDSDTPEIIAAKIYGSPEKHWAVLMLNDIIDPQFDWPLDQRTIIKYMDDKYSANASSGQTGVQWANGNVHSYYVIETRTTNATNTTLQTRFQVDANTYANTAVTTDSITLKDGIGITVATTKEVKTYYDYEIELNESKRTIKLLRPEFIVPLEKELKRALGI